MIKILLMFQFAVCHKREGQYMREKWDSIISAFRSQDLTDTAMKEAVRKPTLLASAIQS